jgi:hypothetical protein
MKPMAAWDARSRRAWVVAAGRAGGAARADRWC